MLTFLLATTNETGLTQAEALVSAGWQCVGVITPTPRPVGRHRTLTPTPAHLWAQKHNLPLFLLDKTIPKTLSSRLPPADFLLVVDFGFYVPSWLVAHPRLLAVNVHPSALPRYRGASPGQYVLLGGDPTSAVSIMTLAAQMDAGDLLAQIPFTVDQTWTSRDYYDHAFALAAQALPSTLAAFADGDLTLSPQKGQPSFAPKITKQQAFIPPEELFKPEKAVTYERQIRAFNPWPLAWTQAKTSRGPVRLQLLHAHLQDNQLVLDEVKIAGETAKKWRDVAPRLRF